MLQCELRDSFQYIQLGMHEQSNLQMLMGLDFALNVALNFEQYFKLFPYVYSLKKHVPNGVCMKLIPH
jgi:hypothetical protein